MPDGNEPNYESIKQNMELTLIITFIGLAFGLVGLLVATARVMSIVVISVAVIVGLVSYYDAFRKQSMPRIALPFPRSHPAQPITEAPKPEPKREPLPILPRVHRTSTSQVIVDSPPKRNPISEVRPSEAPLMTKPAEKRFAPRPRPRRPFEMAKAPERKED